MKSPIPLPTATSVNDAELVARALLGDRFGRDVLYRRHARYLFAVAARLLGNRGEAEEIVQDTFVVGFAQLGTLRDPAAIRAWLTQIAVSLVKRRSRHDRLMRFLGLDRSPEDATLAALASSDLHLEQRAELALLDRLLGRVRVPLRIAWMLRRVDGLSLAEVAAACACSLATVKRRIAEVDTIVSQHIRFDPNEEVRP
jgi:RNA polymerase sigma-70 factor (ECF subfamily)